MNMTLDPCLSLWYKSDVDKAAQATIASITSAIAQVGEKTCRAKKLDLA